MKIYGYEIELKDGKVLCAYPLKGEYRRLYPYRYVKKYNSSVNVSGLLKPSAIREGLKKGYITFK